MGSASFPSPALSPLPAADPWAAGVQGRRLRTGDLTRKGAVRKWLCWFFTMSL